MCKNIVFNYVFVYAYPFMVKCKLVLFSGLYMLVEKWLQICNALSPFESQTIYPSVEVFRAVGCCGLDGKKNELNFLLMSNEANLYCISFCFRRTIYPIFSWLIRILENKLARA